MKKDLIALNDLSLKEIDEIFELAARLKKGVGGFQRPLTGKSIALIFQKPSNRTRVSFEVGISQLGGNSMYLGSDDIMLGVRESIKDVAQVLSRYLDCVIARVFSHADVVDLAKYADIPIINGLSNLFHPCQALSDLFTIREKTGKLKGVDVTYIGDGNNVANSLAYGAAMTGINLKVVTPPAYAIKPEIAADVMKLAEETKARISFSTNPGDSVKGAEVIYTDVWVSMGQEGERDKRLKDFDGFQVDEKLVAKAKPNCLIMHCLPAHRGEEITDGVLDSPQSIAIDQAENRLHVQKALLIMLLSGKR